MKHIPEQYLALIVVAVLAMALGVAGNGDFEDAQLQEREYCENVASGAWADYNGNADEICD